MRMLHAILFLSLVAVTPVLAGQPTRVNVHVLAHDAKLIGEVAGGAHVTIRDARTGRILAEGIHTGGTGSTDALVREPWVRGEDRLDTEGAAVFRATLDLDVPTRVVVEARGPLGFPGAEQHASRSLLLVPGEHIEGDGVTLELQGLIVDLLAPHTEVHLEAGTTIRVEAGVKLLCTCPIEADGLWDAADYRVRAELWRGDELVVSTPLSFDGRPNVFAGDMALPIPGEDDSSIHELRIVAGNRETGNWGSHHAVFRLHD